MQRITRRIFLGTSMLATGAGLFVPRLFFGQEKQDQKQQVPDQQIPELLKQARAAAAGAKVTMQSLRRNVSVLMGSGGNIVVLPGKDGKMMIDSGFASSKPQVTEALVSLGNAPLSLLINTHWHFDHTDGNEWVHGAGATIMATDRTKQRLSEPTAIAAFQVTFPAAPAAAIPTKTFSARQTLHGNDEELILTPYQPAHTDTDTSIYFAQADVLHTGDTWFNGFYPFIDYSTGGSIDGMIRAAELNLSLGTAKTIIVPGHGPVGDKAQLGEFHEMLVGCRAAVAAEKKQGKTLEATVAAKPLSKYDAKFGGGFMKPEAFVALVYQGV